jgi:outer membrane protein OmpA-like peptidoglycan-associated protein
MQLRTPFNLNLGLGADISVSQDRAGTEARALEPYRLFGGLAFTFDTQFDRRRMAREAARKDAMASANLKSRNRLLAADLVKQNREDSLAKIREKNRADAAFGSLAADKHRDSLAMADKNRMDSTAMALRASRDSIYLAEARRNLSEEKGKRTDAENQLLSTGLLMMDAVYFESAKAEISINSKPYLNIIAKMLTKYPNLQIEVAGHTDNIGSESYNQELSRGRAQSVASYMRTVSPTLGENLTSRGFGFSQPKAENATAEGRKLNRRTELQVLNKAALVEYNP